MPSAARSLFGRPAPAGQGELELHRAFTAHVAEVCEAIAAGDFERRVGGVPGVEAVPELLAAQHSVNRAIDASDAFVREAGAALTAAAGGRHHRRYLLAGLRGGFRQVAGRIDEARGRMKDAADSVTATHENRLVLADTFEADVLGVAEQVATASTELSASAQGLSSAASAASAEADQASVTMQALTRASEEIQQVVSVINSIAGQTRLLALNATIESARAGEAGRGFAVVAAEVKELADQTGRATEEVSAQVASIRAQAQGAVQAITGISATVAEMNGLVDGVRAAVDGGGSWGGAQDVTGLSRLAEELRVKIDAFLTALRA
ncbi:methyl-accepting chemotaxis protein [Paenibacillus sp. TRM 82003]|uniref:methyl-accepting chemotaxis protein n=1 Tax=Kineococcus sp. TRM81007 TaxID=2925831 RepID=UPI001F565335|nr:methyl-accepting chemotaxis protein [Kineococcus sp. TRM81007]MCI2240507.1 methyl-accepting chemotaxis protein [Kineococcus sp. TRM81007]MCI3925240.1 methyl-accepting chemotaxis protein [Paenibacillus sp. TRM 82003]